MQSDNNDIKRISIIGGMSIIIRTDLTRFKTFKYRHSKGFQDMLKQTIFSRAVMKALIKLLLK